MIEIYLLEYLYAFYEYGTLSSAAEHLNVAQPSLSRSMKRLEELLGVELFERHKNRIELNDTGKLAVEYAKCILNDEIQMEKNIQTFDKSQHTISIGSCCPGPLMELLPMVTGIFSGMTISSAVDIHESLIQGLKDYTYTLIILPNPIILDGLYCQKYIEEQLFLSVTPSHPIASCHKVSFAEIDGQNFIMYAHVGFWEDIVRSKMPESKFFLQEDINAVGELAQFSDLSHFTSNITLNTIPSRRNGRINIPFSDPESHVWYYLICLEKNKKKLQALFEAFASTTQG